MEPWERGNALAVSPALEYAVHGKYRRTEDDVNGMHGCWWLGLKELVGTLGAAEVTRKVSNFERELVCEREEAMGNVIAQLEAERNEAEGAEQ